MNRVQNFNPMQAYYVGKIAAYLDCMSFPITADQIDVTKECLSHFCEADIDRSQLSDEDKEEQKRQMKQSLEVYIQGVKDEMRAIGRMR